MLMSRKNQLLLEFSFWNEPVPREGPNIYELRSYQLRVSNSSRSSSRRQQCESSGMDHVRLFSPCFNFETQSAITEELTDFFCYHIKSLTQAFKCTLSQT